MINIEIVCGGKGETEELRLKIMHKSCKTNSPDGDHPGGKLWRQGGDNLHDEWEEKPCICSSNFSHLCVQTPERTNFREWRFMLAHMVSDMSVTVGRHSSRGWNKEHGALVYSHIVHRREEASQIL